MNRACETYATGKSCRRKHLYRYELGLRRIDDSRALRMGKAFEVRAFRSRRDAEMWINEQKSIS